MEQRDVVIVGSGYGGSTLACRLAQAGMDVLVLERGPRKEPADLRQSDDPRYILDVIELVVTSRNIGYRTGQLVGGASISMDGAHFRVPSKSFAVRDAGDRRLWPEPYARAALDPYYARAEEMLEIRQFPWDEIPKAGGMFAKLLANAGASTERARMNYADCLQCGFCSQGCIYDKKRTVLQTYIPAAEAAGAEFRPLVRALRIAPSGSGYEVHCQRDGADEVIFGQRVVVACGGLHSPALLLRSAADLPALSPQLGKNFNNNGEHAFLGVLPPEFDGVDDYYCYMGMDNAGMMSFHWFEDEGFTLHPGGGFEPTVFAAALSAPDHPVLPARAWGMEWKRFVEAVYPHRLIGFSALGLAPSHQSVILKDDGSPDLSDKDRTAIDAYLDRLELLMAELGALSDVTIVPAVTRENAGTTSAHLLSACRMGDDGDTGVVDADCRVFGYDNLYVCDSSVIPSSIAVNPALTISAIAERVAEGMVRRG